MANSTSNIDNILSNQAGKEITANAFFDAASPATIYGRRASTTAGLVWGMYGGSFIAGGSHLVIANTSLTLTGSSTTYIEAAQDTGAIYQNIAGFTPGRTPLYTVLTGASTITSYVDYRSKNLPGKQAGSLTVTGDAGFQFDLSNCDIVTLTGTPSAGFNVTIPARPFEFTVRNATGQTATFTCGATNTVPIAAGKVAKIMTDGADVYRVTADI
jgi:hypothetical protein